MTSGPYAVGELVRLKSGSPPLTVVKVDRDDVTVEYAGAARTERLKLDGRCFQRDRATAASYTDSPACLQCT